MLQKSDGHWTKTTLKSLKQHNTGWAKQIGDTLEEWGLEANWDVISTKSANSWKKRVYEAAEEKNKRYWTNVIKKKEETY